MFDERVSKKFISDVIIVLLEDTQEQVSLIEFTKFSISFPKLWEKQAKYLYCVLLATKFDWQSKILVHEPLYIKYVLLV